MGGWGGGVLAWDSPYHFLLGCKLSRLARWYCKHKSWYRLSLSLAIVLSQSSCHHTLLQQECTLPCNGTIAARAEAHSPAVEPLQPRHLAETQIIGTENGKAAKRVSWQCMLTTQAAQSFLIHKLATQSHPCDSSLLAGLMPEVVRLFQLAPPLVICHNWQSSLFQRPAYPVLTSSLVPPTLTILNFRNLCILQAGGSRHPVRCSRPGGSAYQHLQQQS